MGVFIYLSVSKSVTQAEWEPVYNEALDLAQKLGLAEIRETTIRGVNIRCLAVTREYTSYSKWKREDWTGFEVVGDYEAMEWCETNFIPQKLGEPDISAEAKDVMLETYRFCMGQQANPSFWELLGAKTQGGTHHIPLLALGCLIEARLAGRAYVYGDITAGQCRRAVELANHYLDRPISLPVSCNADRLVRRIQDLPIPGEEKLKLLVWAYLGRKDMALGAAVRKAFGAEDCCRYWEERFKRYRVEMPGFSRALEDYLDMGFALEELCRFYSFQEGADEQKRFVQKLLETGLCDNTREMGDSCIDPDQEAPYGIGAVFGQMLQNLTETRVTERFIPIEECKEILLSCMDCPEIIEDCFREYRDSMATKANEPMLAPAKDETEEADTKQYDIFRFDELDRYGSGMRTEPELLAALRKFFISVWQVNLGLRRIVREA